MKKTIFKFSLILALSFSSSIFAIELKSPEKDGIGVNMRSSIDFGVQNKDSKEKSNFQMLDPYYSIRLSPFIKIGEKGRLGVRLDLLKHTGTQKRLYFYNRIDTFEMRFGYLTSALQNTKLRTDGLFSSVRRLEFGQHPTFDSKKKYFSYPRMTQHFMLHTDYMVYDKFLSPKVFLRVKKFKDCFTCAISYSPFVFSSSQIEKKLKDYQEYRCKYDRNLDKIVRVRDKNEASKISTVKDVSSSATNSSHSISVAPKLSFDLSESIGLDLVCGMEICNDDIWLFKDKNNNVKKTIDTTKPMYRNKLITSYFGSRLKVGIISLYAELGMLNEHDLKPDVKADSYMCGTSAKIDMNKISFIMQILHGKQYRHYLDEEGNFVKKNNRIYNKNLKYSVGVTYSPTKHVELYSQMTHCTTCDYNSSNHVLADSAAQDYGVAVGMRVKI